MKRVLSFALVAGILLAICLPAYAQTDAQSLRGTTLYVYNWGEYIADGSDDSMDVNKEFEARYGIQVVYDTFENNEVMYSKIKGGGVNYDVLIPSDYMIERMIAEDMLQPLDFENIPNYKYISDDYKNLPYDPNNAYSVPYSVGMVGLIYNTTMVSEEPTSWDALWNPDYSKKILMINNPRDAFAIAHSLLGIDYNTTEKTDWQAAAEKLKEQKPLVQAYVNDEIYNKMESGEAALAPYYAGDFLTMQDNNPDLAFVYPEEGVNFFVDAMCVPKTAQNKAAAELYINFLTDPDIALENAEYICYASPNTGVLSNEDYSLAGDEVIYPAEEDKPKTQIFENLPQETLNLMSSLWDEVKLYDASSKPTGEDGEETGGAAINNNVKTIIALSSVVGIAVIYLVYRTIIKKKRENA